MKQARLKRLAEEQRKTIRFILRVKRYGISTLEPDIKWWYTNNEEGD